MQVCWVGRGAGCGKQGRRGTRRAKDRGVTVCLHTGFAPAIASLARHLVFPGSPWGRGVRQHDFAALRPPIPALWAPDAACRTGQRAGAAPAAPRDRVGVPSSCRPVPSHLLGAVNNGADSSTHHLPCPECPSWVRGQEVVRSWRGHGGDPSPLLSPRVPREGT